METLTEKQAVFGDVWMLGLVVHCTGTYIHRFGRRVVSGKYSSFAIRKVIFQIVKRNQF